MQILFPLDVSHVHLFETFLWRGKHYWIHIEGMYTHIIYICIYINWKSVFPLGFVWIILRKYSMPLCLKSEIFKARSIISNETKRSSIMAYTVTFIEFIDYATSSISSNRGWIISILTESGLEYLFLLYTWNTKQNQSGTVNFSGNTTIFFVSF